MKKKVITMLLAASLIMSLSGCGNSSSDDSKALASLQEDYDDLQKDHEELQKNYEELQEDYDTLKSDYKSLKEQASVTDTSKPSSSPAPESPDKVYGLGETWTVDGLWSLTINSVTSTSDRNQFSDKNPAQVVIIDYTYQNIGYEDDFMDLYISDSSMDIIDSQGQLASSYPGNVTNYPQETPVGATCANAQVCIGLNNESSEIQITVEEYDNNYTEHSATFKVPVQ